MLITIDVHSGVPAYRQLVDQIRLQVATGRLQAGAEIPSTRALSAELGLNPMTISRAYALLEDEGVLERRPGLSLVVRAQSPARTISARHDQFEKALKPVATLARQLGIGSRDAGAWLSKLIRNDEE